MSQVSFIIVPVANEALKENMKKTVSATCGYWTAPAGVNGDKTEVGDQIWFVGGVNEQDPTENAVKVIGVVTDIIDPEEQPIVHKVLRQQWAGEWSDRKLVVFRTQALLEKDKMTHQEVRDLFDFKRLKNGAMRVSPTRI